MLILWDRCFDVLLACKVIICDLQQTTGAAFVSQSMVWIVVASEVQYDRSNVR